MFVEFSHYALVMFPIAMLKWPKESNLGVKVKAFILAYRLMLLSIMSGNYEMMGRIACTHRKQYMTNVYA